MPKVYPGTAPAAPARATAPDAAPLVVDGHTNLVVSTPPLDAPDFARALRGEQVRLSFVADATPDAAPIHGTLDGLAQYVPDGSYVRGFFARDLALRLAPYAGRVVWVRASCPPYGVTFLPYRVVWALDAAFPLPE